MAKLRIGVLYDYWWGEEEERAEGTRPKRKVPDEDVQDVYEALKEVGHSPVFLRLDGTRESLVELAHSETDLIFNLVESFGGDDTQDSDVAGFLEMLNRKFTGTGSKPAREDGSIGIHFGAVCTSIKELMERIDYIHAEFDSPALIEEYIEGRELYVGVLGTEKPEALPAVELDLSKLPKGMPRIAGTEVKWEEGTEAYETTKPFVPTDLDEDLSRRLSETAVQAFQALHLCDYGRIDFRLAADGALHVLEVNPNPYLLPDAEFAMAAKKAGRSYPELIGEIVDLALARYPNDGA
jgi:D-alanine-D-alanine ligase